MSKDRGLKTRKQIGSTLRNDLAEKLDKLVEVTRINKSKLLDEAVEDLLEKYRKQGVIE